MSGKRTNYISKDCMYMSMCYLIAMRSKDPNSQVGAVIVDKYGRILSLGYNGLPDGCDDDDYPWERTAESDLDTKYPYVVHAELNAILNYKGESLRGSTLYVSMFPCNECAKAIIQSGIRNVIYQENKYPDSDSTKATLRMFSSTGVICRQYKGKLVYGILANSPLKTNTVNQDQDIDPGFYQEVPCTKFHNIGVPNGTGDYNPSYTHTVSEKDFASITCDDNNNNKVITSLN